MSINKDITRQQEKSREEWTDLEYLEQSIIIFKNIYNNVIEAVKQTNNDIQEIELDLRVCKSPHMITGGENLLKGFTAQKQQQNQHIKNIRLDLKHYSSLYKTLKRLDK